MPQPILRKLTLKRFRSLPAAAVEFDNPTFLVGQNGSGKSNFADAFAFLAEAMASPLQAVLARRGGFSAIGNRGSARGRPSNMELSVLLQQLDNDTAEARYGFELSPLSGYGFKILREQCIVDRTDGSRVWFDRSGPDAAWHSNVRSLDPVLEPNALALPLVGGDTAFSPFCAFSPVCRSAISNRRSCAIRRTRTRVCACIPMAATPPACCAKSKVPSPTTGMISLGFLRVSSPTPSTFSPRDTATNLPWSSLRIGR